MQSFFSLSSCPVLAAPPGTCQQEIPTQTLVSVGRVTCSWEHRAQPCLCLLLTLSQAWFSPTELKGGLRWMGSSASYVLWGSLCLVYAGPTSGGDEKCPSVEPKSPRQLRNTHWVIGLSLTLLLARVTRCLVPLCFPCWPLTWITWWKCTHLCICAWVFLCVYVFPPRPRKF